jgi:hypothetical protein
MYTIANLPAIQRDLFLARCLRQVKDAPKEVSTLRVEWSDMSISFATNGAISEASVEVAEEISIVMFTRRMESLLDCGAKTDGASEWVLKYSAPISQYGTVEQSRRLLCDKIAELNAETGETIGVLKIKRRSVNAGHAKIRLVPADNSLQLVCRHTTAQGLKAVWKSALWRLQPQFGSKKRTDDEDNGHEETTIRPVTEKHGIATVLVSPCIEVQCGNYSWRDYAPEVSRLGGEVDIEDAKENGIHVYFPLTANNLNGFGYWSGSSWYESSDSGKYSAKIRLRKLPPGGLPGKGLRMDCEGCITVTSRKYAEFRIMAETLSNWLNLNWNLPEVPADSNENKPAKK